MNILNINSFSIIALFTSLLTTFSCKSITKNFKQDIFNKKSPYIYRDIANVNIENGLQFYNMHKYEYFATDDVFMDSEDVLNPGDNIQIKIIGQENEQSVHKIDRNGNFKYRNIDNISILNKSISEIENEIEQNLSLIYPNINVKIFNLKNNVSSNNNLNRRLGKYKISGLVRSPGTYKIKPGETLLDALQRAGGILYQSAGLGRSVFLRNNKLVPINFISLAKRNNKSQNIKLKNNDEIIISSDYADRVEVIGEVVKPNSYPISGTNNISKAIASSFGLKDTADPRYALLIRGDITNTRFTEVNLNPEAKRESQDVYNTKLKAGDILFIPEKKMPQVDFRKFLNDLFTSVAKHSIKKNLDHEIDNTKSIQNQRMPSPVF